VEFHYVSGGFDQPGPAAVWTRLKVALIAGEEPTATQRMMAVADSGNGISSLLPFQEWWFINTDLSVHLHRIPVGEWIYMDAVSTLDRSGVGLAETQLFDEKGRVGRGAQALMVGPRP
jgi:acyl-CoA thioesterase